MEALRILAPQVFEGCNLRAVELNGEPCVFAREQGRALGYAADGSRFSKLITHEWSNELREGDHFHRVTGTALAWLKERLGTDSVPGRTAHLIVLTRRGAIRAAMLAGGPTAVRFRDWLEGVAFKALLGEAPALNVPVPLTSAQVRAFRELRLAWQGSYRRGDWRLGDALRRQACADIGITTDLPVSSLDPIPTQQGIPFQGGPS